MVPEGSYQSYVLVIVGLADSGVASVEERGHGSQCGECPFHSVLCDCVDGPVISIFANLCGGVVVCDVTRVVARLVYIHVIWTHVSTFTFIVLKKSIACQYFLTPVVR